MGGGKSFAVIIPPKEIREQNEVKQSQWLNLKISEQLHWLDFWLLDKPLEVTLYACRHILI